MRPRGAANGEAGSGAGDVPRGLPAAGAGRIEAPASIRTEYARRRRADKLRS